MTVIALRPADGNGPFNDAEKCDASRRAKHSIYVALFSDDNSLPRELRFIGREAWFLNELLHAKARGVTARDFPGARVSHYVMKLRRAGLTVDADREANTGSFNNGSHARYRLTSRVRLLKIVGLGDSAHGGRP